MIRDGVCVLCLVAPAVRKLVWGTKKGRFAESIACCQRCFDDRTLATGKLVNGTMVYPSIQDLRGGPVGLGWVKA